MAADHEELTVALWCAAHGGRADTVAWLRERGADAQWVGFDGLTPAQAAARSGHEDLAAALSGD